MNHANACIMKILYFFVILFHFLITVRTGHSSLRIVGGQDASEKQYPYVVRIESIPTKHSKATKRKSAKIHVCTGSVLTKTWTVTAAYCIDTLEKLKREREDLKCGHVFHLHCCQKVLANKWIGPRITFSFSQCPICKEDMSHWTLEELLTPIRQLYDEVKRKALMRLEYEGCALPGGAKGKVLPDPATYAMERYAYYVCHKCNKAYFGGLARCEAETSGWWEPSELVCGACSDVAGARTCPKHGADFLEYKCRYCCSVAVFFCFGTSHFCNSCHDDFQRVTSIPKHMLPQCPAGPKGEQLPGSAEECPLQVQHPATGEEFALGCGVCRHAQAF